MYLFFIINIYYIYDITKKVVEEMYTKFDIIFITAICVSTIAVVLTLWIIPIPRAFAIIWLVAQEIVMLVVLLRIRTDIETRKKNKEKRERRKRGDK